MAGQQARAQQPTLGAGSLRGHGPQGLRAVRDRGAGRAGAQRLGAGPGISVPLGRQGASALTLARLSTNACSAHRAARAQGRAPRARLLQIRREAWSGASPAGVHQAAWAAVSRGFEAAGGLARTNRPREPRACAPQALHRLAKGIGWCAGSVRDQAEGPQLQVNAASGRSRPHSLEATFPPARAATAHRFRIKADADQLMRAHRGSDGRAHRPGRGPGRRPSRPPEPSASLPQGPKSPDRPSHLPGGSRAFPASWAQAVCGFDGHGEAPPPNGVVEDAVEAGWQLTTWPCPAQAGPSPRRRKPSRSPGGSPAPCSCRTSSLSFGGSGRDHGTNGAWPHGVANGCRPLKIVVYRRGSTGSQTVQQLPLLLRLGCRPILLARPAGSLPPGLPAGRPAPWARRGGGPGAPRSAGLKPALAGKPVLEQVAAGERRGDSTLQGSLPAAEVEDRSSRSSAL